MKESKLEMSGKSISNIDSHPTIKLLKERITELQSYNTSLHESVLFWIEMYNKLLSDLNGSDTDIHQKRMALQHRLKDYNDGPKIIKMNRR